MEKIVGTRFTFSLLKPAKARPPGRCDTRARERTIAAYAIREEPSRWKERSEQVFDRAAIVTDRSVSFFFPPQPARSSRRRAVLTTRPRTPGA
jgi:hypothetical protein